MNNQDDINPYRDPPPRWFVIGCMLTLTIIIFGIILFFLKIFGV